MGIFSKTKGKKVSLAPKGPRKLEEIQADYQQTAFKAGQAQYQAKVYSDEVRTLNQRLLEINREAAERQNLDAQEAAKKAAETQPETKPEVKNESAS